MANSTTSGNVRSAGRLFGAISPEPSNTPQHPHRSNLMTTFNWRSPPSLCRAQRPTHSYLHEHEIVRVDFALQAVGSSVNTVSMARKAIMSPQKPKGFRSKKVFIPRAAVSVDELPAVVAGGSPPVTFLPIKEDRRVAVRVSTGAEANAGMFHNAYFYFIGSNTDSNGDPDEDVRYPPASMGYFELKGPFGYGSKSEEILYKVPETFDIQGVVLYNPVDKSLWSRSMAALANLLDKDNLTLEINYLTKVVKHFGLSFITDGNWFVNDVLVDDEVFSLYGWVLEGDSQVAFTGKANLPQNTPAALRTWRRKKLNQKQDVYGYQPYKDLSVPPDTCDVTSANYRPTLDPYPAHQRVTSSRPNVDKIPRDEQFKLNKRYDFGQYTLRSGLVALLSDWRAAPLKLLSNFGIHPQIAYESVEDYKKHVFEGFVHFQKPFVLERMDWWSDYAFGYQTVAGINPIQIARVASKDDLPSTIGFFELDRALKERLAEAGTTLETAMEDGKIYKLDYTYLEAFQDLVNDHKPFETATDYNDAYKIKKLGEDMWKEHVFSES